MRKMTCAFAVWLLAASAVAAGIGPRKNPDDQFRFFWMFTREKYPALAGAGFNLFMNAYWGAINYTRGTYSEGATREKQAIMDAVLADGNDYIEQLPIATSRDFIRRYPRLNRDGSAHMNADIALPEARAAATAAILNIATSVSNHPACIGVSPSSEVRDGSRPSFRPYFAESYRRDTGCDVPPEAVGRLAPHYKELADFPESRIVSPGYRLMRFYTWFWKKGDGWNDFQDVAVRIFREKMARPIVSFYDPIVRTPPLWGSGGTELTWGNQWTYSYPEPYNVSFVIAEQQAMARGTPGMGVISMAQGIVKRAHLAPKGAEPAEPPAWYGKHKTCDYFTTPPDMMREALWAMFSRQMDGVGVFAHCALLPEKDPTRGSYQCTDRRTIGVISNVLNTVGRELGPLFRAVPERIPEVAFLESHATCFFAHHASYGWDGPIYDWGVITTAAQLNPYVLFEEEVAARGIPPTVKVIVAPYCEVLAEPTAAALTRFQAQGGVVIADRLFPPALLADLDLPEFSRPNLRGNAADKAALVKAAQELKALARPFVSLPADTDNRDIVLITRTSGDADYVFAINDRREAGDYVGKAWNRVLEKGLPNSGTVAFARGNAVVYDLARHCRLEAFAHQGGTAVALDWPTTEARVLMVVSRPLSALKVRREGRDVIVSTEDRDVMIPIEVKVGDAPPRYGVVNGGVYRRTCPADGAVSVRNLATGEMF